MAPAGSSSRPITVNSDPRESVMVRLADGEVQEIFTSAARLATAEQVRQIAPSGVELLPWVVGLLMAMYVLEAMCAYVTGAMRAKKLEAEEQD